MKIVKLPENGTNFIDYEVDGNTISFDDGEVMLNLKKKERDYDVTIDLCRDWMQGLVMGADDAKSYVAQIFIPARQYKYVESKTEKNENGGPVIEQRAVPFNMDNCTLTLWEED